LLEGHHISQKKKKVIYIDDPLRLGEKIEVSDLCPSCHSLHVSKNHCEACGYQFWVDVLGEPFGPRSFFTLKDDFDALLNKFDQIQYRFWPEQFKKRTEVKRYFRHILKRYADLVNYLSSQNLKELSVESENTNRLFLFETKEIIKEYSTYKNDLSALIIPLKQIASDDAISKELERFIFVISNQDESPFPLSQGKDQSLWYFFREGFLMEALFSLSAIILASFLVMKYMLS
jgi:hypothetical protein